MRKLWVIVLGCIAFFTFTAAQAQTDVIADCTKLLAANRPIPTGADAPTIRIVQPTNPVIQGETVTIEIATTNFDVTSEGRHWHLWVNGQLQGMVYQPNAIIDLAPGTYEICATLGNADHADIGIPAGMNIIVEKPAAGTPTPTLAISRDAAKVLPDNGLGAGQIALVIGGGLLAVVGGWWFGQRMGAKNKVKK